MIIKYNVSNPKAQRYHNCEISLDGYYATDEVINDLQKVIDFHKMKSDIQKKEYIEHYGENYWDKYILEEID